jgi:hypothetical protein
MGGFHDGDPCRRDRMPIPRDDETGERNIRPGRLQGRSHQGGRLSGADHDASAAWFFRQMAREGEPGIGSRHGCIEDGAERGAGRFIGPDHGPG